MELKMTIKIKLILSIIFCISLCGLATNAQTTANALPTADPRVAKALKEVDTEFEISSKDNGYKVTYRTKNNRQQMGFIVSETTEINGVEMRLIFSFAMISDKPPTLQTANLLLEENMNISSGWATIKVDKQFAIVNRTYIPADFNGAKLETALQDVILLADEMEERLTKKDVH